MHESIYVNPSDLQQSPAFIGACLWCDISVHFEVNLLLRTTPLELDHILLLAEVDQDALLPRSLCFHLRPHLPTFSKSINDTLPQCIGSKAGFGLA